MMRSVIAGVIIVLVFIIIVTVMNQTKYEEFIEGLWVADPAFCDRAEIASMMMYIGNATDGRQRNGYIVVVDEDDSVIINQGMVLDIGRGWVGPVVSTYKANAEILFDEERLWADDDSEDVDDPVAVKMSFDMPTGVLRIYSGDDLYARLHKTPM